MSNLTLCNVCRYFQCVSYGSLPTEKHEIAYFLVNMLLMYVAPLVSTLYCSFAAVLEIIRRANTANGWSTLLYIINVTQIIITISMYNYSITWRKRSWPSSGELQRINKVIVIYFNQYFISNKVFNKHNVWGSFGKLKKITVQTEYFRWICIICVSSNTIKEGFGVSTKYYIKNKGI